MTEQDKTIDNKIHNPGSRKAEKLDSEESEMNKVSETESGPAENNGNHRPYKPGTEPEEYKKHLNILLRELRTAFPEKLIVMDMWNHDRWDKLAGYLVNKLGYPNERSFLEAYGFEVFGEESISGEKPQVQPAYTEVKEETVKTGSRFPIEDQNKEQKAERSREPDRKRKSGFPVAGIVLGAVLAIALIMMLANGAMNTSTAKGSKTPAPEKTDSPLSEVTSTQAPAPTQKPSPVPSPTPKPTPKPTATPKPGPSKWDSITFGAYEQDNDYANGKEPIEWIVLDVQDEKVLLLSKYALEAQPYNSYSGAVTWETCSLRSWLNDTFFYDAFSTEEQGRIELTSVEATGHPYFDTDPGNNTQDKVFLLSVDEVNTYYPFDGNKKCEPTEYAKARGSYVANYQYNMGMTLWWLRTPGVSSNLASYVFDGGGVSGCFSSDQRGGGDVALSYLSVRPAIWMSLSDSGDSAVNYQTGQPETTPKPTATTPKPVQSTPKPTAAPSVTYATLQPGNFGVEVTNLQNRLIALNYLTAGSADGDYGGMTSNAVSAFQHAVGLPETGIANNETQQKLFSSSAPKAKVYTPMDYNSVARYPDSYKGSMIQFSGRVVQVMEEGNYVIFRIATRGNYDDVVYCFYEKPSGYKRVLEKDNVNVYGVCTGIHTYTTVQNSTITIPSCDIDRIEVRPY